MALSSFIAGMFDTATPWTPWTAGNYGVGARIWFVYRRNGAHQEVAEGANGRRRRFASKAAAERVAAALNAAEDRRA